MSFRCFYYWAIEPVLSELYDNQSRVPVFEVSVGFAERECKVAVFESDNRPDLARVIIPALVERKLPDEFLPFVQGMKEHLLTIFRLGHNPHTSIFDYELWNFVEDDKPYSMHVGIATGNDRTLDRNVLENLFKQSLQHREEFRLYCNGVNESIPAQYRFLSFYKLLELRFRVKEGWKRNELNGFIVRFQPRFIAKEVIEDPLSVIHSLRDKCAHVRTKRNKRGVSELNHKETRNVLRVLPIMAEMGAQILQDITDGNVVIQPVDRDEQWKRRISAAQ